MKKSLPFALGITIAGAFLLSGDWASSSGNPQRDGWQRAEFKLSRESAAKGDIKLLYSYKVDTKAQRMGSPALLGNIIGYKGFKALLFVGGASDVYSVDFWTGKPYFKTHLDYAGEKPQVTASTATCPGGMTAAVTINGGSGGRGAAAGPPAGGRGAAGASGPARGGGGGGGGGGRGAGPNVLAVGADGKLQFLREQDGDNKATPPAKFLPANSRVSDLAVNANVVYAATQAECGGNPNALYAIDLSTPEKNVTSFPTNGSGFAGSAGVAIGLDGTVYGLIPDGQGSVAGKYNNTVVAMGAKDLAVKDYFTPSGAAPAIKKGSEAPGATPAVFQWNGKDVIISGGTDGRIYLLDSASLGGSDHHTPLAQSDVIAAADGVNGIWNAFATWDDAPPPPPQQGRGPGGPPATPAPAGTRWIYASISGASPLKFPATNGGAPTGSIVAFKVVDQGGKPSLVPAWSSRDMISPAAPAVTNGLVFALSTGQGKTPKNAVLYALDSSTGKEVWSSGQTATSYATGGLAIDASIVLFATHDSQVHAYGIPILF